MYRHRQKDRVPLCYSFSFAEIRLLTYGRFLKYIIVNSVSNQYNQCFFSSSAISSLQGFFAFLSSISLRAFIVDSPSRHKARILFHLLYAHSAFFQTRKVMNPFYVFFVKNAAVIFNHVSRSGQVPRCNKISMSDKSYPVPCKPASSYTYVSLSFSQDNH